MILKALKACIEVQSILHAASAVVYLCKCLFQTREKVISDYVLYGMYAARDRSMLLHIIF